MEVNRRSRRCEDFFCIVIAVFAAVLLTLITYYNAKMTAVFVDWEVIWYIADRPWLHALLFLLQSNYFLQVRLYHVLFSWEGMYYKYKSRSTSLHKNKC